MLKLISSGFKLAKISHSTLKNNQTKSHTACQTQIQLLATNRCIARDSDWKKMDV